MKAYTLKPCRSPYCECEVGKCTHPGFYDARGEELTTIPKNQVEFLLLKANTELMQRVNRMIELLEKQHGVEE
jgi:hypothetical protein